jgi:hypothetical protein
MVSGAGFAECYTDVHRWLDASSTNSAPLIDLLDGEEGRVDDRGLGPRHHPGE